MDIRNLFTDIGNSSSDIGNVTYGINMMNVLLTPHRPTTKKLNPRVISVVHDVNTSGRLCVGNEFELEFGR